MLGLKTLLYKEDLKVAATVEFNLKWEISTSKSEFSTGTPLKSDFQLRKLEKPQQLQLHNPNAR